MSIGPDSVLAGYRVERLLGRGRAGAVYLATHEGLGRRVALKLLAADFAADPRVRNRFIAESRLAASLDHPHIVPIYEAGEADGQLFLAMRYVEGGDLRALIERDGPMEPGRAVRLLEGIADALDTAHEHDLVHRDVKPGNILVSRGSRGEHAYLADFGLVKQTGAGAPMTESGQFVGTVGFVAPEQIEGKPIDGRADVYSLACVLYQCLTGAPPFERESDVATLWAHVQAPPQRPSETRSELAALDDVLATGMAKQPEERFQTAGQLINQASAALQTGLARGFLFADLRGYTAFVERAGNEAAATLLRRYRSLVRDAVSRHQGAEVKTEGDSFYVVFPSASRAVQCGRTIVEAAAKASEEDPERPIRVGIGVHAGETFETAEGYVGSAVNIAARVCSIAEAGEVLVTDTVRALARASVPLTYAARGHHRLKGIAEPVEVFRAGSRAVPPPQPRPRPTGTTPMWLQLMPFAGMAFAAVVLIVGAVVVRSLLTSPPADQPGPGPTRNGSADENGDDFPGQAEAALLVRLPAEIRDSCGRGSAIDIGRPFLSGDNPANLICFPPPGSGAVTVRLHEFGDAALAGAAFEAAPQMIDSQVEPCPSEQSTPSRWTMGGVSGSVTCYSVLNPSELATPSAHIAWVYDDVPLVGVATRNDSRQGDLYAWWQEIAPAVSVEPAEAAGEFPTEPEEVLIARLPPDLARTCARGAAPPLDRPALEGENPANLICFVGGQAATVALHEFTREAVLRQAREAIHEGQGILPVACPAETAAEVRWSLQGVSGSVTCGYQERAGYAGGVLRSAYVTWTYDDLPVLGVANRNDNRAGDLYAWWQEVAPSIALAD